MNTKAFNLESFIPPEIPKLSLEEERDQLFYDIVSEVTDWNTTKDYGLFAGTFRDNPISCGVFSPNNVAVVYGIRIIVTNRNRIGYSTGEYGESIDRNLKYIWELARDIAEKNSLDLLNSKVG
jgi:hypothetical protein